MDVEEIFDRSDINPELFEDSQYRISHEKLMHMWEAAGELSHDPDFGLHLGAKAPTPAFNAAGYLAMTSKNLREAIESFDKYIKLYTDSGRVTLEEGKDISKLSANFLSDCEPNRQHTDFWQVFIYRCFNSIVGWELPLEEAGFQYRKPDETSSYDQIFKCDLKFNQKENYLCFPTVYLDYQTIGSDAALHKVHEMQAVQQLHALTEIGILNKVKRAVFESLPDKDIELQDVADMLNLTSRTVQRNLASEGTTFKKLVDEARRDYTIAEIEGTEFTVAEVAYRLGYKDLSSFYRAFKRWTGTTPVEYRERCHKGGSTENKQ
ncbi:AraC family transcriptional regulator [Maricurvus nonylphenolicus]|uniref:AraC family transcriptional regulator n=1 Tax=Maricurvus nonylphenolicus TaxID=1008307 RepID=UPI0036F222F3